MGGCWSCAEDDLRESAYAPRAVPERPFYPVVQSHAPPAPRTQSYSAPYSYHKPLAPVRQQISVPYGRAVVISKPEPLYGEFKCSCGNFWVSLLTWRDKCQQCRRCKRHVHPKNQRELQSTDYKKEKDDVGEHPMELCQMCKQLGRHCGKKK